MKRLDLARDFWGEMGKLAYLEAIFDSCDELKRENKPINRESVANASGITNTNTISAGIRAWKMIERHKNGELFESPSALFAPVMHAIEDAFTKNTKKHSIIVAEQKAVFDLMAKEIKEEMDRIKRENTELNKQNEELLDSNMALSKTISDGEQANAALKSTVEIKSQTLQSANETIEELKENTKSLYQVIKDTRADSSDELKKLADEYEDKLTKLTDRNDAAEAKLLRNIDTLNVELRKATKELADAQTGMASANEKLSDSEVRLKSANDEAQEVENRFESTLRKVNKFQEAAEKENIKLKEQLSELEKRIDEYKADKLSVTENQLTLNDIEGLLKRALDKSTDDKD